MNTPKLKMINQKYFVGFSFKLFVINVNLFREVYFVRLLLILWLTAGSSGVRYPEYSGVEMPHYDYDSQSQSMSAPAMPPPEDEDYHEPAEPHIDYKHVSLPDKYENSFVRKESWSPNSRKKLQVASSGNGDDMEGLKNYKIERPIRHKLEFSPTKRNWFNRQKDLRDEIVMKRATVPRYMNQNFREPPGKNKDVFSKNDDAELEEPADVVPDVIRRKTRDRSLIQPSVEYYEDDSIGLHRQMGLRADGGRMSRGEREEALRQRQRVTEKAVKAPPRPKHPPPEEDEYDYDDMKRIQKSKSKITTPLTMSLPGQRRQKMQKRGRLRERFRHRRRSTLITFQSTTNPSDEDMNDPAFYTGIHVNILNEVLPAIDDRRKHLIVPSTEQTVSTIMNEEDESLANEGDVDRESRRKNLQRNQLSSKHTYEDENMNTKIPSLKRKNTQRKKAKKLTKEFDDKDNTINTQVKNKRQKWLLTSPSSENEHESSKLNDLTEIMSNTVVGDAKAEYINLFNNSAEHPEYGTIETEFKRNLENTLNIDMIQKLVTGNRQNLNLKQEIKLHSNTCIGGNDTNVVCKNLNNTSDNIITNEFEKKTEVNSLNINLQDNTTNIVTDAESIKFPLISQQTYTNSSLDDIPTGCTSISENTDTYENTSTIEERLKIIRNVMVKENLMLGVYEDGDLEELKQSDKIKSKGRMNREANFWDPAYLEKVKEVMRHRLVARAESVEQLAQNWDDLVCEEIDVETLQKKIYNSAPHCFSTAGFVSVLVPILFCN